METTFIYIFGMGGIYMSNFLKVRSMNKKVQLGKDNELHIFKDVNLEIEGEFVSVMKPSGSGKSTLLYYVSGMDRITFRQCEI